MEQRHQIRRRDFGLFTESFLFSSRAKTWANTYFNFHTVESTLPGRATVNGKDLVSFASKDYLGLTHHPQVKEAAIRAVERYGTSTTGSRALNGTHPLHRELEREIAEFKGAEDALIFSGGYFSNIAILGGLLKRGDAAFTDEDVHPSILDGCVTGGAKVIPFRHNSVEDLDIKIKRRGSGRALIITEGVYSVDGDLGCLPQILEVATIHRIPLMVDDGHGFGILGANGSGTIEHFALNGLVDLDMGIFSAALAGVGGFVVCKKYIRDYLLNFSRGILFTTSLTPATTAGILEALRIIRTDSSLRSKLWSNVERLKQGLKDLGYKISSTESAIVSVPIGDEQVTYSVARMLETRGIFVNTFRRPAVRRGHAKLRLSVSAAHSERDITLTLEAFRDIKPGLPFMFSS